MLTLYEAMTDWLHSQQSKHQLGEGYVETYINDLTQYEFLKELSDAFEAMAAEKLAVAPAPTEAPPT